MVIKLSFCSDFEQRVYFLHLDFEVEDLYNEEIFYVGKKLVKLTEIMCQSVIQVANVDKVFLKLLISAVHGPLAE